MLCMRSRTGLVRGLTLVSILALALRAGFAQAPELRAMWASRFDWPNPDPNTCKATIDRIMSDLAGANFNAVFFQVRGQADVFYPSPYEGWSPLIGGHSPGFDPLAYAINAAHTRGIEFHAYINTHTCWQSNPAEAMTLPADPNHILYKHCRASNPNKRDWLHWNSASNPAQFNESYYVWFAPGVPAHQAYIRQQVLYVVQNYNVDGVHFDRIRTPGSGQPSWDPISLARYQSSWTNPAYLDFDEWTTDQITRTVRDIYAAIMAVKPQVKVSAAVFPNSASAALAQHQDAIAWAQAGALDMAVPMMYTAGGTGSAWDMQLQDWLSHTAGLDTQVVAGHSTSQGVSSLLEQIALTRLRGAAGNSVFSWSSFSYWSNYLSNVYQVPVSRPAMAWKDNPDVGVIYGYVKDPNGALLLDAQVRATGHSLAFSGSDGFYSFVHLAPRTYTVTASHAGYADISAPSVPLAAGQVRRCDLMFIATPPAGDLNHDGHVDGGDVLPFLSCLAGPDYDFPSGHNCLPGDADYDTDVDLADAAAFQRSFRNE